MIIVKTSEELDRMRASGQIAAKIRDELARAATPGVTTGELDDYARELMDKAGARSAFLGYRGFPGHICTSVNEVVVHGIPGPQRIRQGDIVSIDVGVIYEGFVGDTAITVMVGVTDPRIIRLVRVAEEALEKGIEKAVAGARLSDISHAIERVVLDAGFSVVREFVGHGVGRSMHEEPQIPNYGPPGRGPRLRAGMTLAIEPMVNMGRSEVEVMADGWTVVTRDRMPSAHVEHTIAVMEGYAEVLTRAPVAAVR
ncbi:MAG: type I methionyl aminopeptidase [Kiritimatiellae bacterium]|nr:type I methionyl aminopeptidase [Kiritimatiellia bacterium]MDW8457490.1 type I methionyl aminopeptidase [Verrucomicrobiota bacterium]